MKIAEGIGWGCTAALISSAIALTGSCTIKGMSWIIKDNHMPSFIEEGAERVAKTALIVSGLSVVGGILAGAIAENERLYKVVGKQQQTIRSQADQLRQTNLNWELARVSAQAGLEARDKEISRRGVTIRELRQKLEKPETIKLRTELQQARSDLDLWEIWWDETRCLAPEYNTVGCRGCKHFDGSKYGGNMFVCALHPYGQRNCEDWEEVEVNHPCEANTFE